MTSAGPFSIFSFSLILMMLTALVTIVVSAKYGYKVKQLRFIPFYCLASFLQTLLFTIGHFIIKIDKNIIHISVIIFVIIEFALFSNFLRYQLLSSKLKSLVGMMNSIFLIFLTCIWFLPDYIFYSHTTDAIFVFESFFLLIPCLFYFYELFKVPMLTDLKNNPAFWVVTGIFFLSCSSIPLFLLISFMDRFKAYYGAFYSLNYILYILLFLLFIRASTCRIQTEIS